MRGVVLLVVLLAALPAAPAAASRGRCAPTPGSPRCSFTPAKVTFIADGDTVRVHQRNSSRTDTIRFTGINAMELHTYSSTAGRRRGDCHGVEATNLIERYIKKAHYRVRLADQRADSKSGERLRRTVWVKHNGRYVDLAKLELKRGLVLWLPNGVEWAHNSEYRRLAEQAAQQQKGLYDPGSCGAGPDDDLPLRLFVNWDADHDDNGNLDDEWVEIVNDGDRKLSLGNWWIRDSFLHRDRAPNGRPVPGYAFPKSTAIPAHGSIKVHVGCGTNSAADLHWCLKDSAFENVTYDSRALGDGAYLFDPQGDLRTSQIYPCVIACNDPAIGRAKVSVHPNNPESVSVTNAGGSDLSLYGYLLKIHHPDRRGIFIASYQFGPNALLQPGETITLKLAGNRSDRSWGLGQNVLRDREGAVSLRTFTDIVIDCHAWGSGRC